MQKNQEVATIAKDYQINEQIRDKELRIIDENGNMLGIMSALVANRLADERNLDLVKISPSAVPPVCKLMDYGKFKFESDKKEKEMKKNQKIVEIKEIWFTVTTDTGDMKTKAKKVKEFIDGGDKVKVGIRLKGRKNNRPELYVNAMNEFYTMVSDFTVREKDAAVESRNYFMILSPKK